MSKIKASAQFSNLSPSEVARFVEIFCSEVQQKFSNGIDFETNFNGQLTSITFTAANTDTQIAHSLERVPTGYIVTSANAAIVPYNGSQANTDSVLWLRSSGAGTVNLLIF